MAAIFSILTIVALIWAALTIWLPGGPPFSIPVPLPVPPTTPIPVPPPIIKLPWPFPQEKPAAPIASPVERILIEKSARRMTVWQRDGAPREFKIALGFAPDGTKVKQGDGKTPEGLFKVDRLNDRSKFHLSLGLNYPRPQDRAAARKLGVSPGGDIMIHGQPNQLPDTMRVKGDWTAGCVAVTNPEIREVFAHTAIGTPVEIVP